MEHIRKGSASIEHTIMITLQNVNVMWRRSASHELRCGSMQQLISRTSLEQITDIGSVYENITHAYVEMDEEWELVSSVEQIDLDATHIPLVRSCETCRSPVQIMLTIDITGPIRAGYN
jgi:hypothetical protein